jgi:glycolate oxidase
VLQQRLSEGLTADASVRESYASDASGLHLLPEYVARPDSADEVLEIVRRAARDHVAITAAGAQTSTTGASITDNGILLSLRAIASISEVDEEKRTITAGPGALVGDIKRAAASRGLLFAPDPTSEEESTIGGAIACNASGARTFKYGATREHVRALRVVLASGEIAQFNRSDLEKNTVGYSFAHDPIDWFIGSEGTLGIIIEAELALVPLPERVVGLAVLFENEDDALRFVILARESRSVAPRCIEYFDARAVEIARSATTVFRIHDDCGAMVYVEEELPESAGEELGAWLDLLETFALQGDPLVFMGEAQLREARRLRHSVPSTMNERGNGFRARGGRKVSTDWAVPYRRLPEAIRIARALADDKGIDQAVVYGHAGNGHPHQNFIARDEKELTTIEEVVAETLIRVVDMGGTVAAEHGIGKIKRRWLPLQMTPLQMTIMSAVKRELDPLGIFAPGNIL